MKLFLIVFLAVFPVVFTQDSIMKRLNSTQIQACENCVSTPKFFVVSPGLTRENDRFFCLPFPPLRGVIIARHYVLHVQDCAIPYVEDLYSYKEMHHYKRKFFTLIET